MIALALSILALAVAITHAIWSVLRFRGQDQRIDSIVFGDWSKEDTDRIHRSATKAQPMRPLSILLCLALLAPLTAADQPPQLDPTKPADAVQVVEILTRDLTLPRVQAQALVQAIQTLAAVVERDAKASAAAQTQPAVKSED